MTVDLVGAAERYPQPEPRVAVYCAVLLAWRLHGRAPSVLELARMTRMPVVTVYDHFLKLCYAGSVDWTPGKRRTVRVTGPLRDEDLRRRVGT